MFNRIKNTLKGIIHSRLFMVIIAFCLLFSVLVYRVFDLQIVKGQSYLEDYKLLIQKTKELKGTRGRIFDRNGNLLADNKLAYAVTIEDDGSFEADTRKEKSKVINDTIARVIEIVEANGDSIVNDFGIVINAEGEYAFSAAEGTTRQRFIADVYGKRTIDQLSDKQSNASPQEIMKFLCENETTGYNIDQSTMDKTLVLKLVTIRYAMNLNSYQKYIPVTIASDIKETTVAAIEEHIDTLYGINVAEDSLRTYPDGIYFAPLIGYTGKISQDEYDTLKGTEGTEYSLSDIIGKAGIEQTMDQYLQGTKGKETVYVDNVGKVVESQKEKSSKAGNDLYLTIDKNLSVAAYHIIEEKLAGVLLNKIQNVMNYTPDPEGDSKNVIIPIDDVYFALIDNGALDMKHFSSADARENEQAIYTQFSARREAMSGEVIAQLTNAEAPAYRDLGTREMQAYMNYIASELLTTKTKILQTDKIDTNDEIYKAWKTDESVNLYTYLNHAIAQNWIDTSRLQDYMTGNGNYSDANEIYQGILNYLSDTLKTDDGFAKLVYRYMIKNEMLSGNQLCLALFEQGTLAADEAAQTSLASGGSAYDFIRSKIQTLELSPGLLGLEPCTGSVVVTDVNTGNVLACVSYPGYENNRLANTMDTSYYYKLQTSNSRPFYNKATQEKTAPGSTFKMISAVAGLTEGVIDGNSGIACSGIYKKVFPNPKCWIWPSAHGTLDVVKAISVSCNDFFYEVGHRLGESAAVDGETQQSEDNYSSDAGIAKLKTYAESFGLGETSGIEIPESSPQISDTDSVRSAIGQGTNNYTVSQMARYITAVANGGNLYKLSVLGSLKDTEGNVLQTYTPELTSQMTNVASSTWDMVQSGMASMVRNSSTFSGLRSLDFAMAGKTGTAQQSKTHGDHALFVGYAPVESPEIAVAVRIANGFNSAYPAEIGRDVTSYYYDLQEDSELIHGQAAELGTAIAGD